MNDVNNRIFREFTEFFDNVEKSASEISVTMAYEITMKSTISTAIIVLESEGRLEERYWNHLRVQNNILDFSLRPVGWLLPFIGQRLFHDHERLGGI